jgi:hypothetical protein
MRKRRHLNIQKKKELHLRNLYKAGSLFDPRNGVKTLILAARFDEPRSSNLGRKVAAVPPKYLFSSSFSNAGPTSPAHFISTKNQL